MPERSNLVYQYDGSFDGFLCCVFESFYAKENPAAILAQEQRQAMLFPIKYIETDAVRAARVRRSIPLKISAQAQELIQKVFLSCEAGKDSVILDFLRLGYRMGERVTKLATRAEVAAMDKIALTVQNEAYHSLEFLRFSEFGDFLAAEITPHNNILPLMVHHFCDRFPSENFVLYDGSHGVAFLHKSDGRTEWIEGTVSFPDPGEEEENYRRLWRHFYETIAIEGRRNERARMSHMPKRFWPNMTEFRH